MIQFIRSGIEHFIRFLFFLKEDIPHTGCYFKKKELSSGRYRYDNDKSSKFEA